MPGEYGWMEKCGADSKIRLGKSGLGSLDVGMWLGRCGGEVGMGSVGGKREWGCVDGGVWMGECGWGVWLGKCGWGSGLWKCGCGSVGGEVQLGKCEREKLELILRLTVLYVQYCWAMDVTRPRQRSETQIFPADN